MHKQLVHYDAQNNFTLVETSPFLNTVEETTNWEKTVTIGKKLPDGHQWGIVDSNHPWFTDSAVPKQAVIEKPVDPNKPLTLDEVVAIESTKAMKERFYVEE